MTDKALIAAGHILEAIENIRDDTAGGASMAFESDRRLRQLVERNLEVISEASRRIPDQIKALHVDIPWRQVADIGNVMRHEYQRIDPDEIRLVIEQDLEPLKEAVKLIRTALEKAAGKDGQD